MKIAFCSSEVFPFAKTGGLADVVGALPLALEELGMDVIIIMPGYKKVHQAKYKIQRLKDDISYSQISGKVKVYFIENDQYFNRDELYGEKGKDFKDNLERFSYYSKRTLKLLEEINFKPDLIHCHDWQTSLIPVYLKNSSCERNFFKNTKTVLTIHNIGYQGIFPKSEFEKLGLDWSLFNIEGLEFYDQINFLKGGIVFSDAITTVSPTYSKEIQTKNFGFGLEGVLSKRKDVLSGVINGLDYSVWDPAKDKLIAKKFSARQLKDKAMNKQELRRVCKLPDKKIPLFGIVSRLAEQKGFDILGEAIDEICKLELQLVILGTGDHKYHVLLEDIVAKYPQVCSVHLKFDESLAHKIYAGSDIFLMPSKYEPCGLGQMISFKYATIPLVFKTGGLADTVNSECGFIFDIYSKDQLLETVNEAIASYKDKTQWERLIKKAVAHNFSWKESAKKYIQLYKKLNQQ